ncbi:MAG TPA: methionyl-tRNA formyltransferase, partial [Desulfurivibrionaceae bacterium]|nr:methionyl-tRNA formyltransferase [Desulfurivibrionaceae bacterium]
TAHATLNGETIRLFKPQVVNAATAEPAGTVIRADKAGLLVATANGLLQIGELQREGGKRLPAADFLRGHPITPGSRFSS